MKNLKQKGNEQQRLDLQLFKRAAVTFPKEKPASKATCRIQGDGGDGT